MAVKSFTPSWKPQSILFLRWTAIGIAGSQALKLIETITFWKELQTYGSSTKPVAIATSAIIWFATWVFIAWSLPKGKRIIWFTTLAATILHPAWYWLNRIFIRQEFGNSFFILGITATFIAVSLLILLSRKIMVYFQIIRRSHDDQ